MRRPLLLFFLLVVASVVGLPARSASAHNSLESSSPADGAMLESAPTQIAWVFANNVPLDTLTVTLVDASGVRTDIGGSVHGPAGAREVITPLPPLAVGTTQLRWRLVGPDGHPVTGRVSFTVGGPPPPTTALVAPTAPASTAPTSTIASVVPTTTGIDSTDESTGAPVAEFSSDEWSTPSGVRWMLRGVSYLALMIVAGVLMTRTFVWRGSTWGRRYLGPALAVTALTSLLQLVVIASDISAQPWWSAISDLEPALETHAGISFVIRTVLAGVAWVLIVQAPPATPEVRGNVLLLLSIALLATWSFAGHSRSMRWPAIGVPVDVIHHGAAAAWLGGLTILGLVALPRLAPDEIEPTMRRFSTTAEIAVAAIVATGLVQALRLVGSPAELLAATHGKLLVLKLVVLGGMLWVAHANRTRVNSRLMSVGAAARPDVEALRRAVVLELVIGLVIIGVTAAMVVSPPASGSAALGALM